MKNLLLTLVGLMLYLFPANCYAQWDGMEDNIIAENHRAWSIKVAPDGSVWVIATFDQFPPLNKVPKVYRSADQGLNWNSSYIPAAVSAYGWDIAPINEQQAFVALDTAGLYQTIDGGQEWTKVNSFIYSPVYVHFFNASDGWVLANDENGKLVMSVTEDGGVNWLYISNYLGIPPGTSLPNNIPLNESVVPFSYAVSSAYDVHESAIILGTTLGAYWVTTDKGKNWDRFNTPLADLNLMTTNVTMKDTETFMVASNISSPNFLEVNGVNFATRDGGNTWVKGRSGLTVATTQYIPNSDSVFIMNGHYSNNWGQFGTAISYDYGQNWEQIDDTRILAIAFLDENTGYGVCCNNFWPTANGQISKWNFELLTATKESNDAKEVKIWPNPAFDQLTIATNQAFNATELVIDIFGFDGRLITRQKERNTAEIEISIQDLPPGYYGLKISDPAGWISKKFVKIRHPNE